MPTYDYQCFSCGHRWDTVQKISEPALTICPECGAESAKRLIAATAFHLKGSGWYKSDYNGKSNTPPSLSSSPSSSPSQPSSTSSGESSDKSSSTKSGGESSASTTSSSSASDSSNSSSSVAHTPSASSTSGSGSGPSTK